MSGNSRLFTLYNRFFQPFQGFHDDGAWAADIDALVVFASVAKHFSVVEGQARLNKQPVEFLPF